MKGEVDERCEHVKKEREERNDGDVRAELLQREEKE